MQIKNLPLDLSFTHTVGVIYNDPINLHSELIIGETKQIYETV